MICSILSIYSETSISPNNTVVSASDLVVLDHRNAISFKSDWLIIYFLLWRCVLKTWLTCDSMGTMCCWVGEQPGCVEQQLQPAQLVNLPHMTGRSIWECRALQEVRCDFCRFLFLSLWKWKCPKMNSTPAPSSSTIRLHQQVVTGSGKRRCEASFTASSRGITYS